MNELERGMDLEEITGESQEGVWKPEKDLSSMITIRPQEGIITKTKNRKLDKMTYEVYSSILFSKLFKTYADLFGINADFSMHIPEIINMHYNFKTGTSKISMPLCPGIPWNKLVLQRNKQHYVHEEPVKMADRSKYLAGIFAEISEREGLIHGDPQLRHFFLMPQKGTAWGIGSDDAQYKFPTKNGIGIIDVENARREEEGSEEVKIQLKKFENRVMEHFKTKRGDDLYQIGRNFVKMQAEDTRLFDYAKTMADKRARDRFTIKTANMDTKQVEYLPK